MAERHSSQRTGRAACRCGAPAWLRTAAAACCAPQLPLPPAQHKKGRQQGPNLSPSQFICLVHLSGTADPALQVGIASVDSDPGFWPTCDFNTTAAYTDVRALRGWIDATVAALEA